ncbi:MAG: EF-hand domain-containing protein [Pirellulaceae bacterium]|nr:EF-hand domain-containing protein [Pirellulaceae bacterium]
MVRRSAVVAVAIIAGLLAVPAMVRGQASFQPQPQPPAAAGQAALGEVQVVVGNQGSQAETAANQKLIEATRAQADAGQAVVDALEALEAAEGDEARQAAEQQVEQAKARLEQAKRVVARQREAARQASAAARQATVQASYAQVRGPVREDLDPQDPRERFALLLPGGPLVVEVAMTFDGQPFRLAREKLIDLMLATLERNDQRQATWQSALRNPRFAMGRVNVQNDQQRQTILQMLDRDEDGLVDRPEVRRYLAQFFQGDSFALSANGYAAGWYGAGVMVRSNGQVYLSNQADLRTLLDVDQNGQLDEQELAGAAERLKSRDANDNDLLEINELAVSAAPGVRAGRMVAQQLAVLLGPTAQADTLLNAFKSRYQNPEGQIAADSFTTLPGLSAELDQNQDGQLQADELLALNRVAPHVSLHVELGAEGPGLTLAALAPTLAATTDSKEQVAISLPGIRLSLAASRGAQQAYNFEQTANAYLTQYDKDNNGYLDQDELAGNLAQMREMWDADGDGKVYPKEIVESYQRMLAPQQSQIRAQVTSLNNSLFAALERSGDGRLSLREMRLAAERLKELDANQDGKLSPDEIPQTVSIMFGTGNPNFYFARPQAGAPAGSNQPASAGDAPEWFQHMDRNGDGDLTLKEFLGDRQQFRQLDANGDGFIEPQEAQAAARNK